MLIGKGSLLVQHYTTLKVVSRIMSTFNNINSLSTRVIIKKMRTETKHNQMDVPGND